MRLLVESEIKPAGGIVGAGLTTSVGHCAHPGGELHIETEVLEVRPSKSRCGITIYLNDRSVFPRHRLKKYPGLYAHNPAEGFIRPLLKSSLANNRGGEQKPKVS